MANAVEARNLKVVRGRGKSATETLHGLDFHVAQGEIMGLLGPSGCGKTTLMRSVIGVQKYLGDISVLGYPAGDKELRGHIGYMTQAASVYENLTVGQNLEYFGKLSNPKLTREELHKKVEKTLDMLSMGPYKDRAAAALSGGQKGRVSLGCALVTSPKLLVLDEPTVGLDPVTRGDIWSHLEQLAKDGTTLMISSHVMDEAMHCDSMLLMRDGSILSHSTPQKLMEETGCDDLEEAFLEIIRMKEEG